MKDDHVKTLAGLIDDRPDDELGEVLEPIRKYLAGLTVTIITMYQGKDAETFVHAVEGELTAEQQTAWRNEYFCDEFFDEEESDPDDMNNMFFRTVKVLPNNDEIANLLVADGGVD